jgi:hypothetical protein
MIFRLYFDLLNLTHTLYSVYHYSVIVVLLDRSRDEFDQPAALVEVEFDAARSSGADKALMTRNSSPH